MRRTTVLLVAALALAACRREAGDAVMDEIADADATVTTFNAGAVFADTPVSPPSPAPPPPAPRPEPAAERCDPNYRPCVLIDSDVDCAGGRGNGPSYVSGPVEVIGTDIYGLDRDGDGIGCDR